MLKTFLILPDIHVPFHSKTFLRVAEKIMKSHPFDGLVQLGDFLDLFQLSTYDKDPARKNTLMDDVEEFGAILARWIGLLKKGAELHLLCGNHENRMGKYISRNARELHGAVKSIPDLLCLKQRAEASGIKIKWHPYTKWNSCKIGDCVLMHGFYFNQHVAMTNLTRYRTNTICGHTHRVQYVTDGTHYAATLGHGSDETQTAHQPTPTGWTQAIGVLTVDDRGKTSLEIIIVRDGEGVWRGKTYKAV